jgi:hypothetical protein
MPEFILVTCQFIALGLGQSYEFAFTPAEASRFAAGYGLLDYTKRDKFKSLVCQNMAEAIDFMQELD